MTAAAEYIRVTDAPERFGVSRATIYRWAKAGAFRVYKPSPGTALLRADEVRAWIEGRN